MSETPLSIAYLTGCYPRATDTFIQREVAILRELGMQVQTFSVRRPGAEQRVSEALCQEFDRTFYLLPAQPITLVSSHLKLFLQSPKRYLQAIHLAITSQQPGYRGSLYQLFYFAEAGLLARQIQIRQIQHLHNHFADSSCTVAMLAAALGGFTFSFTIHGPRIFFEPQRWRLDQKLQRSLFTACISHFARSQCLLFTPWERWPHLPIVHCGVDPDRYPPASLRPHSKRLLYVGRLAKEKGIPILLQAIAQLKSSHPQLQLTLIGDGDDRPELEQLVQALDLAAHVKFLGYQSQEAVRQQLQDTDLFVLPSFAEGVPVSLMEAMASGLPVVTTAVGGMGELVEPGVSGLIVPPGDQDRLGQAIDYLLRHPALRQTLGVAGRLKVAQDFNLQREGAWLARILRSALAGRVEPLRPCEPCESAKPCESTKPCEPSTPKDKNALKPGLSEPKSP